MNFSSRGLVVLRSLGRQMGWPCCVLRFGSSSAPKVVQPIHVSGIAHKTSPFKPCTHYQYPLAVHSA